MARPCAAAACRTRNWTAWPAGAWASISARERVALAWAESLTHVDRTGAPDEDFAPLQAHFSDTEISDLTFAIALMSAFNRLAIGMRQ